MLKLVKLGIPVAVGLGVLASASLSFGTAKIAKDTGVKCTACHSKLPGTKENLNAAGTCYKEKKDLGACKIEKAK